MNAGAHRGCVASTNPKKLTTAFRGTFHEYEGQGPQGEDQDAGGRGRHHPARGDIEPLRDKHLDGNGVVDMLSIRPGTGLVKTEVPFLTQGFFGNVVSLHIEAKGDLVLDLLKNSKPDWSLIAEQQIFSYSQLAVVGR